MNTTTNKTATEIRYISVRPCPCGAGHTSAVTVGGRINHADKTGVHFDKTGESGAVGNYCVPCRGCGRSRNARPVTGRYSARHTCGARCLNSHGPSCECSCGGKNHGASFGA